MEGKGAVGSVAVWLEFLIVPGAEGRGKKREAGEYQGRKDMNGNGLNLQ